MKRPISILNPRSKSQGFSLVEIVLAIGIVSFALLSVIALLPIGMAAVKNSTEESFAVQVMNVTSNCIHEGYSESGDGKNYTALFPFNNSAEDALLQWTVGDGASVQKTFYIQRDGFPTRKKEEAHYYLCIKINPPAHKLSSGMALIGVVWPVTNDEISWKGETLTLGKSQHLLETVIYFIAK